jgi:hypothetical protein
MEFAPANAFRVDAVCISFSFGFGLSFHVMILSEDSFLGVDYPLFLLFIHL